MSHLFTLTTFIGAASLDVQAFILAIASGLITAAIIYFVTKERVDWKRWRATLVMGIIAVALVVGLITYRACSRLVEVPPLDGLAQAQAEDLLRDKQLVPLVRPQPSDPANAGRVIPHSQSPSAGLSVRAGTVVSFAVGEGGETTTPPVNPPPPTMSVSLFKPKSGETISVTRGPDGIYRLSAQGTLSGLDDRHGLLLWLRPVNPPADRIGWYLQKPPNNGVTSVDAGTWTGIAQVGNAQYPPHEGNTIDVAISIAEKSDIDKLMAEEGVVVRNEPVGVKTAKSSAVVVTLK